MHELNNNQFFLIISEIHLFPELSTNHTEMIEQVMNGLLLSSGNNIQLGINKVVELEVLYKSLDPQDIEKRAPEIATRIIMDEIKAFLKQYNLFIVRGEDVRVFYPLYHKNKHYGSIGKQAAINTEFALEKKINYDGQEITFTDSYTAWVNDLLSEQREQSNYNADDKLVYHFIEPQASLKHVETINIIRDETERYLAEVREVVKLQQELNPTKPISALEYIALSKRYKSESDSR